MPRHPLSTTVKFLKLHDDVELPERKSDDAAGMDIRAYLPNGKVGIPPMERKIINTGFKMELDPGYEAQIRPRSGLAIKEGITVVNSPGTIDADYRGEVKVGLLNTSSTTYILEPGTRIAQMVIAAVPRVSVQVVTELSETKRGEGGLGSTGKA